MCCLVVKSRQIGMGGTKRPGKTTHAAPNSYRLVLLQSHLPPLSELLAQTTYDHPTFGALQTCLVLSSFPLPSPTRRLGQLDQRAECSTVLNSTRSSNYP
ncbi:hypothetical protein D9756_010778 [Leucocoprinus leucothites]|uniref:Uncharacterized protein n=1 Tax=Leucocoprinus leucothites TaxID=201217 RepID=A0A8H5FTJ7_9AGAR|nr:hypothetical protein D9756_010778 [Leucoagaricus leucothites]